MSWLLSLVGVVFLGLLFDLIYPNGKTNALCKSIFGLLAIFVMISPILNLDIDGFNLSGDSDSVLVSNINKSKDEALRLKIIAHLTECGISGIDVEIDSNLSYDEYQINYIYVDTTNLVLTEKLKNINKYEVIAEEVNKLTELDRERIIVYG